MSRAKVFTGILMVLILIALSGAAVWAAPGGQEPVPMLASTEEPTAEPTDEPTAEPTEEPEEPAEHPVASALANYFADALGLDYEEIMGHHEDGTGFGVIAQACWMSYALNGDAELLGAILEAKREHDFDSITLPDDIEEPPKNWGQFKRVVLGSKKAQRNLGEIMSGRAEPLDGTDSGGEDELGTTATEGKVKGKKDKAGGKPEIPPGKVKDKDKGGGPPAEPPGKVKNKDKGKGGGEKQ